MATAAVGDSTFRHEPRRLDNFLGVTKALQRRAPWGQGKCGAISVAWRLSEQQGLSRQRVAQGTGEVVHGWWWGFTAWGAADATRERDESVRAATLTRCCCLYCVLAIGTGCCCTSRWVRLLDSDATSARAEHCYCRQDQDNPQDDDGNELQHAVEGGTQVARGGKEADTERDRRRVEGRREGNMKHATDTDIPLVPVLSAICRDMRVPSASWYTSVSTCTAAVSVGTCSIPLGCRTYSMNIAPHHRERKTRGGFRDLPDCRLKRCGIRTTSTPMHCLFIVACQWSVLYIAYHFFEKTVDRQYYCSVRRRTEPSLRVCLNPP